MDQHYEDSAKATGRASEESLVSSSVGEIKEEKMCHVRVTL
jgi:hypothetical protein